VEAVVLRALEKDPDDRYDSADQMAADLFVAMGRHISSTNYPTLPTPPSQTAAAINRLPRRMMWLMGGIGVALVIVMIVAALLIPGSLQDDEDVPPQAAPTVLVGEEATAEAAVPTIAEISWARRALGDEGFIAYITCTLDSEYHATQTREMGDLAAQYGIDFRIYDSDADFYRQITQIEKARADGATGLIICPLDPELLSTALKSAQEAGLALVFLHSDMPNYGGVLLAGDDYLMGLTAGRFAGQIIREEMGGQADAIILDFPSMPVLVVRANGLEDGVLEEAPEANIVGRYRGGTREFGEESVREAIANGVPFDVILSINDAGSFGAIAAMEDAGIAPDEVFISSVDAEALALEYIEDGYFMRGSVRVNREEFSDTAINTMIKLLAGSTLPETFVVPPGDVVTRESLLAENGD
jgi:ABC-type sugar transport system substrate-binding protein